MEDLESLTLDELFERFAAAAERTRLHAALEVRYREDNTVARLVALLDAARPEVRATAAYTLGQLATEIEALDPDDYRLEENPDFRARIAAVPGTLDRMRALYEADPDPDVRYHAFRAIFFYAATKADPAPWCALAAAGLDSADVRIRHTAAFAMQRFEPHAERTARALAQVLVDPEEDGSNGWQESAMMLEEMGAAAAPALPALEARLRSSEGAEPDLRASLLDAVRAIDTAAVRALLAELGEPDADG